MLYLPENYDEDQNLAYPQGSHEYDEMLSWVMWQCAGFGPMHSSQDQKIWMPIL